VGAAGRGEDHHTYVDSEHMPSHRIELGEVPLGPADAPGQSGAYDADYGIKGFKSYANNRNTTSTDGYFGIFSGAMGAAVAPLLDILRPSKRQNTIGTMRPYQNPESTVKNSYLFNPADRPGPTIREMTENGKGHLFVNTGKERNGYLSTGYQAPITNRQDTTDFYYSGIGGTTMAKEPRPYDAEYKQHNNEIKSSTIANRTPGGNMALFNGDINMRNKTLDNDLIMRRQAMPSMPYQSPDVQQLGRMSGSQPLYSGLHLDRNAPEILGVLQSNPYHIRSTNGY
jgi:hypothetical protein